MRQLLPWAVLAVIFFTDLRPEVFGRAQRLLLLTGLWQPARTLPAPPVVPVRAVAEGAAAYPHDLPLYTLDGQLTNLRELQGKVVLLNLWASWCPPCRAEMPGLQRLYAQVDKSRIAFVMVSLDQEPKRARRVVEREQYTFPVYFPAAPLPPAFQTQSIPTTFVLTPDGRVAGHTEGMADYDNPKFLQYLNQLAAQ